MTRAARREDWQTLPGPAEREWFDLDLSLSPAEAEQIRQGFVPSGSDDRWFLFVEGDVLYCHRSWTGASIFGARLEEDEAGARLGRCWVSRDAEDYRSSGLGVDGQALLQLVRTHLLAT